MDELGFEQLMHAPRDILGQEVQLLHWSGATEVCVLATKDEAATAIRNGWTRYRTPTGEK